jgi:cytochrome c
MLRLKLFSLAAVSAMLALGFAGGVAAADGANLFKTKTCWSCHGKDAKTPIMPMYPKLAGQSADYAYNQMVDIKSGARNNGQTAAMKGVMGLVSDDEMKAIAEYLSKLPK